MRNKNGAASSPCHRSGSSCAPRKKKNQIDPETPLRRNEEGAIVREREIVPVAEEEEENCQRVDRQRTRAARSDSQTGDREGRSSATRHGTTMRGCSSNAHPWSLLRHDSLLTGFPRSPLLAIHDRTGKVETRAVDAAVTTHRGCDRRRAVVRPLGASKNARIGRITRRSIVPPRRSPRLTAYMSRRRRERAERAQLQREDLRAAPDEHDPQAVRGRTALRPRGTAGVTEACPSQRGATLYTGSIGRPRKRSSYCRASACSLASLPDG